MDGEKRIFFRCVHFYRKEDFEMTANGWDGTVCGVSASFFFNFLIRVIFQRMKYSNITEPLKPFFFFVEMFVSSRFLDTDETNRSQLTD